MSSLTLAGKNYIVTVTIEQISTEPNATPTFSFQSWEQPKGSPLDEWRISLPNRSSATPIFQQDEDGLVRVRVVVSEPCDDGSWQVISDSWNDYHQYARRRKHWYWRAFYHLSGQ